MDIVFQEVAPVHTVNTTVAFRAEVGGTQMTCEISEEALQDHFGAISNAPSDLIAVFMTNRSAIEDVARRKYIPGADRWLIRTNDF